MTDIRIRRDHAFGLPRARELAWQWAQQSQSSLSITSRVSTGETEDRVQFQRAGVDGTLVIAGDHFELTAKLGFLLAAFRPLIEAEIARNLDALMAGNGAPPSEAAG